MKAQNRQQVVNSQLSPSDIVLTLIFRVQSSGKVSLKDDLYINTCGSGV